MQALRQEPRPALQTRNGGTRFNHFKVEHYLQEVFQTQEHIFFNHRKGEFYLNRQLIAYIKGDDLYTWNPTQKTTSTLLKQIFGTYKPVPLKSIQYATVTQYFFYCNACGGFYRLINSDSPYPGRRIGLTFGDWTDGTCPKGHTTQFIGVKRILLKPIRTPRFLSARTLPQGVQLSVGTRKFIIDDETVEDIAARAPNIFTTPSVIRMVRRELSSTNRHLLQRFTEAVANLSKSPVKTPKKRFTTIHLPVATKKQYKDVDKSNWPYLFETAVFSLQGEEPNNIAIKHMLEELNRARAKELLEQQISNQKEYQEGRAN